MEQVAPFIKGARWTLTVGAAPFINGHSNLQLQVGAAPFIKGATLQLEPNIYNKLAELQRQIQQCDLHMNSGDTIQIEAPDFDLDIDDISPTTLDQESNNQLTQGTTSLTPKSTDPEIECTTSAPSNQHTALQEMNWPDAIPVEILSQIDQPNDQRIDI